MGVPCSPSCIPKPSLMSGLSFLWFVTPVLMFLPSTSPVSFWVTVNPCIHKSCALALPCLYQCQPKGPCWRGAESPQLSPWHGPVLLSPCCPLLMLLLLSSHLFLFLTRPCKDMGMDLHVVSLRTVAEDGVMGSFLFLLLLLLLLQPCMLVLPPAAPFSPQQPQQKQRGAVPAPPRRAPGNEQISWWAKYNYKSSLGASLFQDS